MIDLREHGIGAGGIGEFFGDGSDGTIPDLNTITTAPNGGDVTALWDMNASTVFTTGILSSASDQVVFQIDFGVQLKFPVDLYLRIYNGSISVGTSRQLAAQGSNDNLVWNQLSLSNISTSLASNMLAGDGYSYRYLRLVLKSGGSDCTLSCQGVTINYQTGDALTTKVWRITYPVTPQSGLAVKQFTSLNLPAGYEITTSDPCQGLILYSQGDVTVNGTIDMSQKAGLAPNGSIIPMVITKKAYKTAYTESLLHFNSTLTDENGRTWTNNGSATFDTTNKVFGSAAISFNGLNQWIDTPASDDFSFGYEDFTIETWVRPTSIDKTQHICGTCNSSGGVSNRWSLYISSTNKFVFHTFFNGVAYYLEGTTLVSINTWYHVVVTKNNGIIRLFINGVKDLEVLWNFSFEPSKYKLSIGRLGEYSTGYFAGQIDEFRVVKGKAMWTSNFTPPTTEYTYQATYIDEPKTLEKYFQLTTVLQALRGGYGGNGGYGGGKAGSYRSTGGSGGAGRQNLGGFGGGGGGGSYDTLTGGNGGNIEYAELGGGDSVAVSIPGTSASNGISRFNGAGAQGGGSTATVGKGGKCNGGGGGGSGSAYAATSSAATDGQFAGGFVLIIAKGNVSGSGSIKANGGTGGAGSGPSGGSVGSSGGGGGGSGGGTITILYKGTYIPITTLQVNGGAGGAGNSGYIGSGEAGGSGTSGSVGTIHIQSLAV